MRTEITRSSVHSWRKETIVDVVMSLALTTGAIPGVREVLEAACSVARASPANGGGIEAAVQQLKRADWRPSPQATEPLSADNVDPDARDGDSGNDANFNGDGSFEEDNMTTDQHPPSMQNTASQPTAGSVGGPASGLCRSNWKGTICTDNTCTKVHKEFCLSRSCYPARSADCLLWHPRPWISPKQQGNGRKGNGQPTHKAAKSKVRSNHAPKETILSRENKLLRQEVALYKERSRLEAKKNSKHRGTISYRDAVVSNLPKTRSAPLSQLTAQSTRPLSSQVLQGEPHLTSNANSVTVLPANILAAIQHAVERAFDIRNPH